MKVNRIELEQEPMFEPFAIKVNVESKEEAQALYAIFNYAKNSSLIGNIAADKIQDAISREYYVGNSESIIANGISYQQYYYGNHNNQIED